MKKELRMIYVDVETGTWGDAKKLYLMNLTDEQIETLDERSTGELAAYAIRNGIPAVVTH